MHSKRNKLSLNRVLIFLQIISSLCFHISVALAEKDLQQNERYDGQLNDQIETAEIAGVENDEELDGAEHFIDLILEGIPEKEDVKNKRCIERCDAFKPGALMPNIEGVASEDYATREAETETLVKTLSQRFLTANTTKFCQLERFRQWAASYAKANEKDPEVGRRLIEIHRRIEAEMSASGTRPELRKSVVSWKYGESESIKSNPGYLVECEVEEYHRVNLGCGTVNEIDCMRREHPQFKGSLAWRCSLRSQYCSSCVKSDNSSWPEFYEEGVSVHTLRKQCICTEPGQVPIALESGKEYSEPEVFCVFEGKRG